MLINDEFNTNVLQYGVDSHRRIVQIQPVWEVCPMSNSRIYLTNHETHQDKEILLARSIYFDVPIRDMAIVPNQNSFLLFQVEKRIDIGSFRFVFISVEQRRKSSCSNV